MIANTSWNGYNVEEGPEADKGEVEREDGTGKVLTYSLKFAPIVRCRWLVDVGLGRPGEWINKLKKFHRPTRESSTLNERTIECPKDRRQVR